MATRPVLDPSAPDRRGNYSTFSDKALCILEEYFSVSGYPSIHHRRRMSGLTGETESRIQNWFKRERAKCLRRKEIIPRGDTAHLLHRYEMADNSYPYKQMFSHNALPIDSTVMTNVPDIIPEFAEISFPHTMIPEDKLRSNCNQEEQKCQNSAPIQDSKSESKLTSFNKAILVPVSRDQQLQDYTPTDIAREHNHVTPVTNYPRTSSKREGEPSTVFDPWRNVNDFQQHMIPRMDGHGEHLLASNHPYFLTWSDMVHNVYRYPQYWPQPPSHYSSSSSAHVLEPVPQYLKPGMPSFVSASVVNRFKQFVNPFASADFSQSAFTPVSTDDPTGYNPSLKEDFVSHGVCNDFPMSESFPGNISPILNDSSQGTGGTVENIPSPTILYNNGTEVYSIPQISDCDKFTCDIMDPINSAQNRSGECGY